MINHTVTNTELLGLSNGWKTSHEKTKAYDTTYLTQNDNGAGPNAVEPISSYTDWTLYIAPPLTSFRLDPPLFDLSNLFSRSDAL